MKLVNPRAARGKNRVRTLRAFRPHGCSKAQISGEALNAQTPDDAILARLLALNLQRAAPEAAGAPAPVVKRVSKTKSAVLAIAESNNGSTR